MLIAVPTINAILNGTSATLLLAGFFSIRLRAVKAHRACMTAAIVTSTLFLISYLIYHSYHGTTSFPGNGMAKTVYRLILGSHTILAIVIVPLVIGTFLRASRGRFGEHARLARWTFPLWLYVSVTGVIVYLMLYQLYPSRI